MFFKRIISVILVLLTLSCGSSFSTIKENELPRKSYLFIKQVLTVEVCSSKDKKCQLKKEVKVGSGFIVKITPLGSFAMTAAHVCLDKNKRQNNIAMKVKTLDGRYYKAKIVSYDRKIDACMMFVEDLVDGVEEVKLAEEGPKVGDKVINISSPFGIQYTNVVPIFKGTFAGRTGFNGFYTFSSGPGASGSMILNSNGELIGLVHSIHYMMNEIVVGVPFTNLKQFIRKNRLKYFPEVTRFYDSKELNRYQKLSTSPNQSAGSILYKLY
jgi:S1-C subfamily serine protease